MTASAAAHLQSSTTMSFSMGSAAIIVAAVLPVGLFAYHSHLSRRKKGEPPVRWSWLPVLGYALEMGNRPLELLIECAKQYGEIFGLVVAGNRLFIITDPHSYQLIFTKNKDLSYQEFHTSVATNMFGANPAVLGITKRLISNFFS
jgi:sterol 14-demethylase